MVPRDISTVSTFVPCFPPFFVLIRLFFFRLPGISRVSIFCLWLVQVCCLRVCVAGRSFVVFFQHSVGRYLLSLLCTEVLPFSRYLFYFYFSCQPRVTILSVSRLRFRRHTSARKRTARSCVENYVGYHYLGKMNRKIYASVHNSSFISHVDTQSFR